jgi:hypothetical protein
MTLPVPTAHLDDALTTLVVMGDGAKLSGIEFPSSLSRGLSRALAGLPASADEAITFRQLLSSMKGSDVEIRIGGNSPETVEGRLINVIEEEKEAPAPSDKGEAKRAPPALALLVVTRLGEFRRFDAADAISVRPTDPAVITRMSAALDALGSKNAQTRRALRLLSSTDRPITLGYLAETPIWRTTYRLLLDPSKDEGLLQGWALVHNDTDETWRGVAVELVNGQPDSFLFPLAAPRYSRRSLAEPGEKLATVPQLLDTTVDQIWGDNLEEGLVGYGEGGGGSGYGLGHGRLGGSHKVRAPQVRMGATTVSSSDSLRIGNLAAVAQATGVETGSLFSYRLAEPLDLGAHGSALVPFLASTVTSRRLTWFDTPGERGRSGLRLINATGQTLPAAPVAIYERGGFAGETGIERLDPADRAFLTFGVDLDVELSETKTEVRDETKGVFFENEQLGEDFVRLHERAFTIENRARTARNVYLSLDIVENSKVEGADEVDFDQSSAKPLSVFRAEPGKKMARTLHIQEGLKRESRIEELESKRVKELATLDVIPAATRAVLVEAAARLVEAETKDKEKEEANGAITEVTADIERLRAHLTALGDKSGRGAAENPIVKRILGAEDRLTELRAKVKSLEAGAVEKRAAAKAALQKLGREPKAG